MIKFVLLPAILSLVCLISSCGSDSGGQAIIPANSDNACYEGTFTTMSSNSWRWVCGSDTRYSSGTYGTKGSAEFSSSPGARVGAATWTDSAGNMWLFGGSGYDAQGSKGLLNDLWKFDGNKWIWISGSHTRRQQGIYGSKGVADANNVPGGRSYAFAWIDGSDTLWLFGGLGFDSTGATAGGASFLNDLWKFNGVNWTWVSGSDLKDQVGMYGVKGVVATSNIPGGQAYGTAWIDSANNLWLFGGIGYGTASIYSYLNSLWKFDGTNWTWVSGSDTTKQYGDYGVQGVSSATNVPGARDGAVGWVDASDNLWLFGGHFVIELTATGAGVINDLWKFDGANWTWMNGSNVPNQSDIYGTKGIANLANVPGARSYSAAWIDVSNNLWLFGGDGVAGRLNDLWKFDGMSWTWVSGNNTALQAGLYGGKGSGDIANIPGARSSMAYWRNSTTQTLWLFGGNGQDSADNIGELNDLWQYQP